jgi:hexosaminidase
MYMRRIIIITLIGVAFFSRAFSQSPLPLMPVPQSVTAQAGSFTLSSKSVVTYNNKDAKATAVLLNQFLLANYGFSLKLSPNTNLKNAVHLIDNKAMQAESYTLNISKQSINISGNAAGLFYGIRTLQQLFPLKKSAQIALPAVQIKDSPRFAYRGLMLDVSRHFFPVSYVKKFLEVMSQYKLNNFHWHLTDDQGWRIEIKKYPRLQDVAAWRTPNDYELNTPQVKDGRYGGYYTQQDVKDVIAYAAARHINIVPEIEMPGHATAALAAYPWLGCTGGPYAIRQGGGVFRDVYCAGKDSTFMFLQDVLSEVIALFPGKYIHVGGDECPKDSWKACPRCQARIKAEGLHNEHELQSYFIQRMEKFVNSKGRKLIGWDEILEGGLAPNATVMSWRGETGGIAAARQQHDVIMTPYTYLYLDYYQGRPATEPPGIGGYLPLPYVYRYEPMSDSLTTSQQQYIKGVQANTWAEYISTEQHMDYMVYPRALALAEIGWSPREKKNYADFTARLASTLARLDKQGVSFRIPEPLALKDSVTTAGSISLNLQPAVQGAAVYYTIDGSQPTLQSSRGNGMINLSLSDNVPVTVKAITVLAAGRQSTVYSANYIKKPFKNAVQVNATQPGVLYKAMYGNINSAKTLSIQKADTAGVVNNFSIAAFEQRSGFGVTYEGYFMAAADGIYTFSINSDDGTALYVADELIVDNDGRHGPTERAGSVPLKKGYHKIRLNYFDADGGKNLFVKVLKDGFNYPVEVNLTH